MVPDRETDDRPLIAIGDIHGCLKTLKALWKTLRDYPDALLIFVGDYIDRGPDSKGVVDFLLQKQHERECVFLRGNHEQMLLDAYKTGDAYGWMVNGGEATLSSYGNDIRVTELPENHLEFYKQTLPYYETKDYFFVHAGAQPEKTLAECKKDPSAMKFFLWGREHINLYETAWEKVVVFGHTPKKEPIDRKQMIGIDTGCVYKKSGFRKLTAVLLPDRTFIQQPSLD